MRRAQGDVCKRWRERRLAVATVGGSDGWRERRLAGARYFLPSKVLPAGKLAGASDGWRERCVHERVIRAQRASRKGRGYKRVWGETDASEASGHVAGSCGRRGCDGDLRQLAITRYVGGFGRQVGGTGRRECTGWHGEALEGATLERRRAARLHMHDCKSCVRGV